MPTILATVVVLYLSYLAVVYVLQEKLIFAGAGPDYLRYKRLAHLSENITISNCHIQGWGIPGSSREQDKVLIYFGGNAQDNATMTELLANLKVRMVYTFNYRNYGLSTGRPSEANLYNDALAIYQHVKASNRGSSIILVGQSLGASVAGYLATKQEVEKLVLISPLQSIAKLAEVKLKHTFPGLLVRHRFDLYQYAKNILASTLVVIAENDSIIPVEHSLETYGQINTDKVMQKVPGSDHNDIFMNAITLESINNFISTD